MSEEFWNVRLVGPGIPLRNKRIRIPLLETRNVQKRASEIVSKNMPLDTKRCESKPAFRRENMYAM